MALTKAEKQLIEDLRTAAAFLRTEQVLPDVMPPEGFRELSTGYTFVAPTSDRPRVDVACSSSIGHSTGKTDRTTSQRPMRLFSTKLLALKALRFEVENECAKRLRRVDVMIEQEMELRKES